MSVKSFQYSFGAGDTKQYRGGDYFAVEECSADINIELFTPEGNSIGVVENVGAGFWIKIPKDNNGRLGRVDVTSATAQQVNVIVGSGEFGVNKTSTTITGGTLDPDTLSDQYFRYGISSALHTVVTPAANVNGVKVFFAVCTVSSMTTQVSRVMTKTTAPTGYGDAAANTLAVSFNEGKHMGQSIIVPAGHGIYEQSTNVSAQSMCAIEYEIL